MSRFSLKSNYVVTGGTKGIGLAIVQSILTNGSSTRVLLCARTEKDVVDTVQTLNKDYVSREESGPRVIGISCDVASEDGRQKLLDTAKDCFDGVVDGLVNNVGMNIRRPVGEQTMEEYTRMMSTNVDSVYFICKSFESILKDTARAREEACVVNISSMAGCFSSGTGAAYGMTKAAVIQFTKILGMEWAKYNIRVNAVAPWMTMTPMLEEAVKSNPSSLDKVREWTPCHRLSSAEEAADPAVFLLMKASSYMTGQCICVDGGLSAQGFDGPCVTP